MSNISAQQKWIERKLLTVIGVGIALTTYGLYVELKHDFSQSYEALCDINSVVSCSAAFLSDYGKGFGFLPESIAFRNPIYGLVFYAILLALLRFAGSRTNPLLYSRLFLLLALLANLSSIYLAYILLFILRVACLVCISLYVVNFVLLIFAFRYMIFIQSLQKRAQSKRHN